MIDQATFAKWQDWSKRDDAHQLFVPSDIRQMLGEIERQRKALERCESRMSGHPMWDSDDAGPSKTLQIVRAALNHQ